MKVRPFVADLHIHSVLSPCGDYHMAPGPILTQARQRKLDLIAITDHNSGENVQAFCDAFRHTGIGVLPGMEVTTAEEAHVLTFFDTIEMLTVWQAIVYDALPPITNDEEAFGVQVVVNAYNEVKYVHQRFFSGAASLSIDTIVSQVHALGGLCIPAHVDKPGFSVISQLGAIPQELDIIAAEIYRTRSTQEARKIFPDLNRYSLIRGSDAHYLQDIGTAATTFFIKSPTIQELRNALLQQNGRSFTITPM